MTHTFAVCAYGDSPYLDNCLRSLVRQPGNPEIICCTSTPSHYIEETVWKYGIPLHVRDGESNIQDDWNFAYETAKGDLVTLAHQDDMYHKDYETALQKRAGEYPDMTVFFTDYATVKGTRLIIPTLVMQAVGIPS